MTDRDAADAAAPLAPADLARALAAGDPVRVLDVRDRDEVETWRLEGPAVTHTHIPYAKFMAAQVRDEVGALAADVAGDGPVTVVCGQGEASDYVADLLAGAGVEARNLEGGMDAWGRVMETRVVSEAPTVVQYARPATGCLSYAVVDGGEALLVDPLLAHADRYRADLGERGADLVAVFDTHLHADHLSGLRELAGGEARRLLPAGIDRRGLTYDGEPVGDGDRLTVGDVEVSALALPGHTTEMTGLRVGDVLLAGDSVFLESVARPDLQEGVDHRDLAAQLYTTLTERLPADDPVVAPGHYRPGSPAGPDGSYTARLSAVRERVAAFGMDREAFVEHALADHPEPANAGRILAINRGTETAEDPFELEVGPNNCAV